MIQVKKTLSPFGGAIIVAAVSAAALATTPAQAVAVDGASSAASQNQTTRSTYLATVFRHVGEHTPTNTCVSQGVSAWASESGLAYPERTYTAAEINTILGESVTVSKRTRWNVTAMSAAARQGLEGYRWINATEALPGDWLIWPDFEHISVLVDKPGGFLRSIGAAGPTQRVNYQPLSGGNPASYYQGAIRPPYT